VLTRRELTIVLANPFYPRVPASLEGCARPCRLIRDPSQLPEADIVVYHIPTLRGPITLHRRPGQMLVGWSMESNVNYPLLADPLFMQQFDLTMTYRRDADIWTAYFGPDLAEPLLSSPRPKTEAAPAVYFASNCHDRSGRNAYIQELMTDLQVDSYGRCLQNKTLSADRGRETKLETMARYKFTLAFENSISEDYVTEKFFDPLIAGSVPVYLGAPNVADFAPGERCFIDVQDFAGPRELADELQRLAGDNQRYDEYLAWKERGFRREFLEMLEQLAVEPLCRLCLRAQSQT
jgi:hypothetical protein